MNRAQRRAAISRAPKPLRKPLSRGFVPVLDISPEQLAEAGLKARQGDLMLIPGKCWDVAASALKACAKGEETPFRINIKPGAPHGVDQAAVS